jgi:hypothetical protein
MVVIVIVVRRHGAAIYREGGKCLALPSFDWGSVVSFTTRRTPERLVFKAATPQFEELFNRAVAARAGTSAAPAKPYIRKMPNVVGCGGA